MATDLTVIHYGNGGGAESAAAGASVTPPNVIAEYKLVGAWPSAVSAIDLAWDSNDTLETFDITWQYQYWERVTSAKNNTSALTNGDDNL